MSAETIPINFIATEKDRLRLDAYAVSKGRTRSDVLRELISTLDAPEDLHIPRRRRSVTKTTS